MLNLLGLRSSCNFNEHFRYFPARFKLYLQGGDTLQVTSQETAFQFVILYLLLYCILNPAVVVQLIFCLIISLC